MEIFMKKLVSVVLSLVMMCSVPVFAQETVSDWAVDTISIARNADIVTDDFGVLDFTQDISRAKFCELSMNVLESLGAEIPEDITENPFSDVTEQDVLVLNKIGVINGKGDGLFAPNDNLTREEAATILYRMTTFLNMQTPETKEFVYYIDENLVSDWAKDAVYAMRTLGVMQGTDDFEFSPEETFTIEQAIATVLRIYSEEYRVYSDKNLGKVVIWINDDCITDRDINYHISANGALYANKYELTPFQMKNYNWDSKENGRKISEKIVEQALYDAMAEVIMVQMGEKNGITLSNDYIKAINSEIGYLKEVYGEEELELLTQAMGLSGFEQYKQMYVNLMARQLVQDDIEERPENYYPSDMSVLKDYASEDYVTALHILVSDKETAKVVLAKAKKGVVTGTAFMQLLESRLDNLVYRIGFARTRRAARQLVNHGHVLVNGKKVDIPSYACKAGDVITLKETSKNLKVVAESLESLTIVVPYVEINKETKEGKFIRLPERNELARDIDDSQIVEYYNRKL